MWNRVSRVSEWLLNFVSLGLLIYIALILVKPRVGNPARSVALRPGQAVPISGIDWGKSHHTLVLALQTGCHFCAESAPFYKALLKDREAGGWQAVAVLPQPVQRSITYMQAEGYSVPQVRQINLSTIGVSGTPTLLLVNDKGRLEKKWIGELGPTGENEVAAALGIRKLAQGGSEAQVELAGMGLSTTAAFRGEGPTDPVQSSEEPAGTKTLRVERLHRNAPVVIAQVLEGNADIPPDVIVPFVNGPSAARAYILWDKGVTFQAGDDWMKNLVFVYKNVSNKELIAMDVDLFFPQTGSGTSDNPVSGYLVMTGRPPDHAMYNSRTGQKHTPSPFQSKPLNILPNQEIRLALAPFYDAIKASIESNQSVQSNQSVSSVTECQVDEGIYYFADGTRWQAGKFEKPDPNTPGGYLPITPEEFNNATPVN